MNFRYTLQFNALGRTAETDNDSHIREMIEQVLFTAPGERVNRPTFGSGLLHLVFAPNADALAAATRLSVQASLQEWLGDLIEVSDVGIENEDATLRLEVRYIVRRTGESRTAVFLCCTDGRRAALQRQPSLNGIDFLEVADLDPGDLDAAEAAVFASLPPAQRPRLLWQRRLTVVFV